MLFNLVGKKEETIQFSDKTYLTAAAKQHACLELAKTMPEVLFIAWFPDTARRFRQLFVNEVLGDKRILEVRQLHASKIKGHIPVFVEHFPMHLKEQELVKNWGISKIDVYNSLEEPLFANMGGEKIVTLMKNIGLAEHEMPEHPLVSKSIFNAQERMASQVTPEQSATSQLEWIEKNLK